jgi:alpha-L-fucosidase
MEKGPGTVFEDLGDITDSSIQEGRRRPKCRLPSRMEKHTMDSRAGLLVKPTEQQARWADCEIGVLIHYDIQVFSPAYEFREQWGWHPEASVFNPAALSTDQWIQTARAAGARYAVLVAKHCSGFCLWPTEAHAYSVKHSPWKDGKGDIVRDFVDSCSTYGMEPGLYYSCSCNAFLNVDNPGKVRSGSREDQDRYNELVIQQLTELWGNYGRLFEIWFDGGILPPEMGGPDIVPLLSRLQPAANVFQGRRGMPSLLRWAGNESGQAPDPCWSTTNLARNDFDGTVDCTEAGTGDPHAPIWAPAESDMPNRNKDLSETGGWFWKEGEDGLVYSAGHLLERYLGSVGHNANLLLGMAIDNRGLVPDQDSRQLAWFGELVTRTFGERNLLGETAGMGKELTVELAGTGKIGFIVIMEDIRQGERVLAYRITGWDGTRWLELCSGSSVGHKRIHRFGYPKPEKISRIRLVCDESKDEPVIRRLAVYR